jgi:hypothetical protein
LTGTNSRRVAGVSANVIDVSMTGASLRCRRSAARAPGGRDRADLRAPGPSGSTQPAGDSSGELHHSGAQNRSQNPCHMKAPPPDGRGAGSGELSGHAIILASTEPGLRVVGFSACRHPGGDLRAAAKLKPPMDVPDIGGHRRRREGEPPAGPRSLAPVPTGAYVTDQARAGCAGGRSSGWRHSCLSPLPLLGRTHGAPCDRASRSAGPSTRRQPSVTGPRHLYL